MKTSQQRAKQTSRIGRALDIVDNDDLVFVEQITGQHKYSDTKRPITKELALETTGASGSSSNFNM